MAYSLKALIAKDALISVPQIYPAARLIRLHYRLHMLPLTRAFTSELQACRMAEQILPWEEVRKTRGLPSWFEKENTIVADLASQLSEMDPVAYVEADFFGGVGSQSALVWQQGQVVLARNNHGIGPINEALRYLGVQASNSINWFDEFLMVGLGQKRDTEKWSEVAARQEVNGVSEWEAERLKTALAGAEKALGALDPESPIYQIATQQKKWVEQILKELR